MIPVTLVTPDRVDTIPVSPKALVVVEHIARSSGSADAGYDDDEVLNLAQIETPAGMPRPVIVRPADLSADRPEWLCLCANEEDPV